MKSIVFAFAVLLCGVTAFPRDGPQCQAPHGGLIATIKEILEMVPVEEVAKIYLEAVSNDEEVQKVMEYIQSDDFTKVVTAVHKAPQFHKLMKSLCDDLFVDAYYYLNVVGDLLGWPVIERPSLISARRSGVNGMLEDILDVIPTEKILELLMEKLESDEYVKKAVEILKSKDFVDIVKTVTELPEYQHMESELRKMGVEVDEIIAFLEKFFGWGYMTQTLIVPASDGPQCQAPHGGLIATIKEILEMVPVEEVAKIYLEAVSNDEEVQKVMEYIQSDDFTKVVTAVHKAPQFHKLMKSLCDDLFVDAYYYLNVVGDLLGWPVIERPSLISARRSGVNGMLEDILDVIPTEKILELLMEKLESDEYVKKAVEILKSKDFVDIVKTVTELPEYQHMESELRKMGVEVDEIIAFLEKFFGWGYMTTNYELILN